MIDRCDGCKNNIHCEGRDTYEIFDQDGRNTYVCQCSCGHTHRTRENAAYALAPIIRRYGKELLLEVLMNDRR